MRITHHPSLHNLPLTHREYPHPRVTELPPRPFHTSKFACRCLLQLAPLPKGCGGMSEGEGEMGGVVVLDGGRGWGEGE